MKKVALFGFLRPVALSKQIEFFFKQVDARNTYMHVF